MFQSNIWNPLEAVVEILVLLAFGIVACGGPSSSVLTEQYGTEMESAFYRYQSLARVGWIPLDDPYAAREVMTASTFSNHLWLVEQDLAEGGIVILTHQVVLEDLKVLSYSNQKAVVWVRYWETSYSASQKTRERVGWILEQASEGTITFIKEDGQWKVAGDDLEIVDGRRLPTPTPEDQ